MPRTATEIYEFNGFRLDVSERLLLYKSVPLQIPEKAFETLRMLVRNSGRLVTKEDLLSDVWAGAFVEENNLDKSISTLRRALGEKAGKTKLIETVRGHGYRFVPDVRKTETDPLETTASIKATIQHPRPVDVVRQTPVFAGRVHRGSNIVALADWRPDSKEVVFDDSAGTDFKPENIVAIGKKTKHRWRNSVIGLAVLAASIAIAIASFMFVNRESDRSLGTGPWETYKVKRFSDNGSFNPAVISPDGKFIAYTDINFAVWIKNAATDSNVKILSEFDSDERSMIGFSPDGDYLYFQHSHKEKKGEILKMAVFGGVAPQKISEDAWSQPSLSPDGKQIALTRYESETGAFLLIAANTDGTGERVVTRSMENERFDSWIQATAWSPDSSRIACVGRSQEGEKITRFIVIFRAEDGVEIQRIRSEESLYSMQAVAWLTDGENLLVIGNDQALLGQIYHYSLSTYVWRRVTNDLSDYRNLSIAADGKTILATIFDNQSNLWVLPDADANRARQITFGFNTISDATGISWAADGRIVYATNTSGRWEIWMIYADGSDRRQLTQNCAGNFTCAMPFVSPDNRYIVFHASRDLRHNIWRMDIDGSNPVQLTTDGGMYPFVTPDGKDVIYLNKTLTASKLFKVPIEGGDPKQITKISDVYLASLSPDGRLMAFTHYDKSLKQPWQICVAAAAAQQPEKCFTTGRSFPRWNAEGTAFYTIAGDFSGIWRQMLDGKRDLFLEFPGERINNFAFSPDGKQLAVARSRPNHSIVALIDEQ